MRDNGYKIEEDVLGRISPSSYSLSHFNNSLTIKVKDVCVYDCIDIIKGFDRHFNIKTVLIRKRGGGSV